MAGLLAEHSELIPVLNRFGIRLGVGDKSVSELCEERGLNTDLILTVLNVYLDESFVPDDSLLLFDAESIVDYFHQTVESYIHDLIPNIEKHLNAFIAMSGSEKQELKLLREIFREFKERMTQHLRDSSGYEENFPNELLHDLKQILIQHLSPGCNQNLCHAVIFSLHSLQKDLEAHNRVRDRVLLPKVNELSPGGIERLQTAISSERSQQGESATHQLSDREIEVLRLIVQGHLNKEIAEQLNISLNTVLTHRKNIIAKTGIRTVSGLTFYSLRNGLVSMQLS
ncbi:MAG: LuxR C-terminal-related transcriptional regulator [Bacteroidota bacterium]|nr:LuxR C-terminal-related transcriptional regulator [Bacteroidota bacterium]